MGTPKHDPTQEQWQAYVAAFAHFNQSLWGGKLPTVILNFSRQAHTYGFFAPERWEHSSGTATHELSINPSHMRDRAPAEVYSTLVHEMAHLWQTTFGKPGRRGYHNHEWGDEMERVGLMPSHTGSPGGKRVGTKMSHYIIDGGAYARAFSSLPPAALLPWLCKPESASEGKGKGKSASTSRNKTKYTCPGCESNVWGKPGLNIVCGDCDRLYEAPEDEDEAQAA